MTPAQARTVAQALKALADPIRVELLVHIRDAGDGGVCVKDLTALVPITGPTVSYHVKALKAAGLVSARRFQVRAFLTANPQAVEDLADLVRGLA